MCKRNRLFFFSLVFMMVISIASATIAFAGEESQKGEVGNLADYQVISSIEELYHAFDFGTTTLSKNVRISCDISESIEIKLNNCKLYIDEGKIVRFKNIDVSGNSVICGKGTIKRLVNGYGNGMITCSSENVLTILGITVDGGAIWSDSYNEYAKRNTTNTGIVSSTKDSLIKSSYGGTIYIDNVTIQNHDGNGNQSFAILVRNAGSLFVDNCEIKNNSGRCDASGCIGSAESDNIIKINNSKFYGNLSGASGAGAVFYQVQSGNVKPEDIYFINCEFKYNSMGGASKGGGIGYLFGVRNFHKTLHLENCYIHDNSCGDFSGNLIAAYNTSEERDFSLIMSNTKVENNKGDIESTKFYPSGNTVIKDSMVNSIHTYIGSKMGDDADILLSKNCIKSDGLVAEATCDYQICEDDVYKFSIADNTLHLNTENNTIRKAITVTFNNNGGLGESYNQLVSFNFPTRLIENTFSKESSNFIGWSTSDSGNVEYEDKESVTFSENKILFAIWNATKIPYKPELGTQTYTYDGTPKAYVLEGYEISYQQNGSSVTSPTDSGKYDVIITKAGDSQHEDYSCTLANGLVIEKAKIYVEAKEHASVHMCDEFAENDFKYIVKNANGDDVTNGFQFTKDPTVVCGAPISDSKYSQAGTFDIIVSGAEAANYDIEYKDSAIEVTPHQHNTNDKGTITAPTCEENGYTTYTCSVCHKNYNDDYTDPIKHDYKYSITSIAVPSDDKSFIITWNGICQNDETHERNVTNDKHFIVENGYADECNYTLWICKFNNAYLYDKSDSSYHYIKVSETIEDQQYTGSELKTIPTVRVDGEILSPTEYTVSYANNKEIGTATATVTYKGKVIGSAKFNIVNAVCSYAEPFSEGISVKLLLDGEFAGAFSAIKNKDGEYYLIDADGKYLTVSNREIIRSENSFAWKYDGGLYCELERKDVPVNCWWGLLFGNLEYYLSYNNGSLVLSCLKCAAEKQVISGTHTYKYKDNYNGTHTPICTKCGETGQAEAHSYDAVTHHCVCSKTDPIICGIKNVIVTKKEILPLLSRLIWNGKYSYYLYSLSAGSESGDVRIIETSKDKETWSKNNYIISKGNIEKLYLRITDKNNNVSYWEYNDASGVATEIQL